MTLQESLAEATARWCREDGTTPEDINGGNCEAFADEVASRVPGAVAVWDWEADEDAGYPPLEVRADWCHCFIRYNGMYYDSECHAGVADWIDLPFFKEWDFVPAQ